MDRQLQQQFEMMLMMMVAMMGDHVPKRKRDNCLIIVVILGGQTIYWLRRTNLTWGSKKHPGGQLSGPRVEVP